MKYIIGVIVVCLILSITTYFLGDIWGYTLISYEQLKKGLITIAIIGVCLILLLIFIPFFFKNHTKGYDNKDKRVAQPKNE